MSIKTIQLTIPSDKTLPDIINSFSPEENYLMLKIGSDTLREGRKVITNLTNDEVYRKIENDFKKEIESLDMEIKIEKETSLKMQEKIAKMYESQIEQLNKKLEVAMNKITISEQDNSVSLNEAVNKVKEKYDLLLEEKDRQNKLNRDAFDKAIKLIDKTTNKSSISIGDDGEHIFENLAETFKDFENYKIENKAKQGHKGDFHLFFKDFNVLVDSKNYTGSVQKKEIIKIESDLLMNDNMNFAWMVSLNSNICEYNKFTIMTKWVTTDVGVKCILFINNLLSNKEPRDILRQAWMICNDFYRLTKKTLKEDGELEKYREKFLIYKKHINNLQDRAAEIRRGLNISFNTLKHMDNDLLEMLSLVSDEVINNNVKLNNTIKEWWDNNIEYVNNDESKMTSTEIWNKFKKDNKEYVGDNKITIEDFKNIVTSNIVSTSAYIEKSRNIIEFNCFRWKQNEVKTIESENIIIEKPKKVKKGKQTNITLIENLEFENEFIFETNEKQSDTIIIDNLEFKNNTIKKKVKKEKNSKIYFDEERDKKILDEYDNISNDIMSVSLINNIRPWEVVSLLVRYKIIKSRGEARGYDKYKETEEYKSKIVNK